MRQITFIIVSTLIVFSLVQTAMAQDNKQNVLNAAKAIEMNAKTKESAGQQARALKWLIETEDISLIVCGHVFSLFSDKKNKNSPMMTLAYMIGMGAFKIGSPDKVSDENAAQLAGLMLALKAYGNGVADKPKTKNDKMEVLLQKRTAGELSALVTGFNCGKK
jgi:hypothetical protein